MIGSGQGLFGSGPMGGAPWVSPGGVGGGPSWGAHGWGGPPSLTPNGVPNAQNPGAIGAAPSWLSSAPQAVQDWFNQMNPQWMNPQASRPWLRPRGVAGPTLSGRQPVSAYRPVGRSPGGDPLVSNTGQVGTPVPMAGGSPGGLLAQLFDPSQHAGLAYAGMANAGNKGIDYTSASSRGLTDQILGQPIPTGGFGIGTGLLGGVAPSGMGTPVNVRAARLAAASDADQAAQVQAALPGGPDWWNTVMNAVKK